MDRPRPGVQSPARALPEAEGRQGPSSEVSGSPRPWEADLGALCIGLCLVCPPPRQLASPALTLTSAAVAVAVA